MKIVVFGSTGGTGRELVSQALEQGHTVTAFARDVTKVGIDHDNLEIAQGDVMDPSSVERAVEGQEAVLCSIGGMKRNEPVRSEGTRNIIEAMEKFGVRRLICQSTLGAGDSRDTLNFWWKYVMFGLLIRPMYKDHELQERHVMGSPLDWTIVRPASFQGSEERTGQYRHGFPATDKTIELKISRADTADFMLKQLTDDTYLRKAPGLSY